MFPLIAIGIALIAYAGRPKYPPATISVQYPPLQSVCTLNAAQLAVVQQTVNNIQKYDGASRQAYYDEAAAADFRGQSWLGCALRYYGDVEAAHAMPG